MANDIFGDRRRYGRRRQIAAVTPEKPEEEVGPAIKRPASVRSEPAGVETPSAAPPAPRERKIEPYQYRYQGLDKMVYTKPLEGLEGLRAPSRSGAILAGAPNLKEVGAWTDGPIRRRKTQIASPPVNDLAKRARRVASAEVARQAPQLLPAHEPGVYGPEADAQPRLFTAREVMPGVTEISTPATRQKGTRFFTNLLPGSETDQRNIAQFEDWAHTQAPRVGDVTFRAGLPDSRSASKLALNPDRYIADRTDAYNAETQARIDAYNRQVDDAERWRRATEKTQGSPLSRFIADIAERKRQAYADLLASQEEQERIKQAGELAKQRATLKGFDPDQTVLDGSGNIVRQGTPGGLKLQPDIQKTFETFDGPDTVRMQRFADFVTKSKLQNDQWRARQLFDIFDQARTNLDADWFVKNPSYWPFLTAEEREAIKAKAKGGETG